METEFKRYAKYEVIKLDDIEKYLNQRQREELAKIINTIQNRRRAEGKVACNNYVVVNEDQPYAEIVWKLIELGVKDINKLVTILPEVWKLIQEQQNARNEN